VAKIYLLVTNGFNWSFKLVNRISWSVQQIIVASQDKRKSFWFWSEEMNMCELMINFSILGKLLYRQKQTILLPLFNCALYCCSVMINIKKGRHHGYSI